MDKKISQLDPAAALDGTELLAVVQGGSTLKSAVSAVKTYLDGYYVPLARTLTINGTSYDLTANRTWNIDTLPAQAGNNGKFLTTDGSTASWGTITQPVWGSITGTLSNQTDLVTYVDNNLYKKGGNTFGANCELGTNDAYQLAFRTNGTARITISSTGETGIMVAPSTDARLTIGNGSTTRASLRLMSGGLLTTPISGAIENDGTNLYYTDNTPTRYALLTTATGVTGSGTTNYVPKWTSSNVLGNSLIFDNGTNVGIGTASPGAKLDIIASSGLALIAQSTLDGDGVLAYFRNNDAATVNNQETQIDFQQQTSTIARMSLWHINSSNAGFKFYGYSSFLNSVPMLSLRGDKLSGVNVANPLANWHVVSVSGNNPFRIDDTTSSTTPLFIEDGGNVAINKTSSISAKFHLKGSTSDNTAYALKVDNSSSSALLYVRNDGNVGIGTNSPLYRVHSLQTSNSFQNGFYATNLSTGTSAAISMGTYNGSSGCEIGTLGTNTTSWTNYGTANQSFLYTGASSGFNFISQNGIEHPWTFYFGTAASATNSILHMKPGIANGVAVGNFQTPSATLHVKGYSSDSSYYALKVDNSTPSALFYVMNDGKVSIGTTSNDVSAKLQIDSTTQGVLLPRMTTAERNAISTPANGLEIYNTSTTSPNYYDGTTWQQVTNKAYVDSIVIDDLDYTLIYSFKSTYNY